jgi:hypothetical protein
LHSLLWQADSDEIRRKAGVAHDEYAVSPDGMKASWVLDLATEMEGCRFSVGLRNSHDKSIVWR